MKRRYLIKPSNPNWGKVLSALVADIDANVRNGKEVEVICQEPKRSADINAALHALCGEVAKQKEWAGLKLDAEGFKRLFVDAWCRETGRGQGKMIPSLDGQSIVVLGMQTRSMPKSEMVELMAWIEAWAVENGVRFAERKYE